MGGAKRMGPGRVHVKLPVKAHMVTLTSPEPDTHSTLRQKRQPCCAVLRTQGTWGM